MAKLGDRIRDWWEGLQPRERSLMSALGITAVVCVLGFVAFIISDGLAKIETRNELMQEALQQLQRHRLEKAKGVVKKKKQVTIPEEEQAVDLETYVGKVASEVEISYPKFNRGGQERDALVEATGKIEFRDITLAQLTDFLSKLESNPLVVVREIRVKQDFRDKEKLDVPEMVIATFYKKGAEKEEEADEEESE